MAVTRKWAPLVERLLEKQPEISAGDLARKAGVSRQAAHRGLRALVEDGRLERLGGGRSSRYRRACPKVRLPRKGLEEDVVWKDHFAGSRAVSSLSANAREIAQYAFTEMVNNAIDHSAGKWVEITMVPGPPRLAFEIIDDGVGVFQKLRREKGLRTEEEALQELSKGKLTTAPDRHSGEGIFFVSKAVDRFELESGKLLWLVDNVRKDTAVGEAKRKGTRVRFELSTRAQRRLAALFDAYTSEYAFTRTRIYVRLFELGTRFVSRSEAKRLLRRLEGFEEAVLDFKGVELVGQGFVDEVFRVFTRGHPRLALTPVNMRPAVERMVRRALA
jgi:anti-sigma regulatory factor (Ser/Thr protein kinase)